MSWEDHHQPRIVGNRYLIAIAVMISSLTAILDQTIVNVSIPTIQAAFGADIDQITWVITGFLISNVVIIPMTGWLSNLIGLKRYYMLSQLLFVGASMLCGLAWSLPSLVFFRILQGIGGGALLPVSLSIMLEAFPAEQTASAMAIFGLGTIIGPILGPVLGGWLTENLSWRWIFYVNFPIVTVGMLMTWIAIGIPRGREATQRQPIDVWGLAFVTVWLATMQVVLQNGQRDDWFQSSTILALTAISIAAFIGFLVTELRVAHPFIDLRLFLDRNFTAGTLIGVALGGVLFGAIFVIPIFCAQVLGYNALDIGLTLLPAALAAVPMFPLAAWLTRILDARIVCGIGFIVVTLSNWLNSMLDDRISHGMLVWFQATRSIGLPLIFIPLSVIGLQFLAPPKKPDGSALFNLTRTLAGSLGVAALGSFIVNREKFHFARLGESLTQFTTSAQTRLGQVQAYLTARAGSDATTAHQQSLAAMKALLVKQAAIAAFDDAFRVLTVLAGLAILLVFVARSVATQVSEQRSRSGALPAAASE